MLDLPMLIACAVALLGSGLFAFRHYSNCRHDEHYHHQEVVFLMAFVIGLTLLSALSDAAMASW